MRFTQNHKVLLLETPLADRYGAGGGDSFTPVVDMTKYGHVTFIVAMGANTGGTGRVSFTVDACDDATPTNTAQSELDYRTGTGSAPDTLAEITHQATPATGFPSIAAANCVGTQHIVEVEASWLEAAGESAGTAFVAKGCRLNWTEEVDDPIVGCIIAILSEPRFAGSTMSLGLLA